MKEHHTLHGHYAAECNRLARVQAHLEINSGGSSALEAIGSQKHT